MSNKYSEDGRFIIDDTGRQWRVNTWHPLPTPDGINQNGIGENCPDLSFCGFEGGTTVRFSNDTHWLARAPLPPVPKVKTQEEKDEQAYGEFCREAFTPSRSSALRSAWDAALAYARKSP